MILKYRIGKIADPSNIGSIAAVFEEFMSEREIVDENMVMRAKELNDTIFNRERNIQKITAIMEKNY